MLKGYGIRILYYDIVSIDLLFKEMYPGTLCPFLFISDDYFNLPRRYLDKCLTRTVVVKRTL